MKPFESEPRDGGNRGHGDTDIHVQHGKQLLRNTLQVARTRIQRELDTWPLTPDCWRVTLQVAGIALYVYFCYVWIFLTPVCSFGIFGIFGGLLTYTFPIIFVLNRDRIRQALFRSKPYDGWHQIEKELAKTKRI